MRHPELRPSVSHRPDERPPPGAISTAVAAGVALLALGAVAPLTTAVGAFIGACVTVRWSRRGQ